jgi:MFS family permease
MRGDERVPFDVTGFVLAGLGIGGLAFGLTTAGVNYLPASVVVTLVVVGAISAVAYVWHARRTPAPLLDISLFSLATFRASVLGGFIFRIGVGALPFLLPLLLQLGFNMTPFESGLITFSTALGAMSMKAVVPAVLRQFGFRWTLTVNAILSAAFLAACAGFRPGTPVVVMMAVLVIGGFFRSLEFTSINTIAYAEIDKRRMSRATSLVSVAQQLSMSTGIAVGALMVELTMRFSDHGAISAESFPPAFLLVGALSASAAFVFIGLAPDAGAELANRTPGPTEAADQRMG